MFLASSAKPIDDKLKNLVDESEAILLGKLGRVGRGYPSRLRHSWQQNFIRVFAFVVRSL